MRKVLSLIFCVLASASVCSATTVQQLQHKLANAKGDDAKLAQELGADELSERLSESELSSISAALPGPLSRQALLALADRSAFLPPPRQEIPRASAPAPGEQAKMVARVDRYIASTLPSLPDFVATRHTIRFQDRMGPNDYEERSNTLLYPLRLSGQSTSQVIYRPGSQAADADESTTGGDQGEGGLRTQGAFGSVLATVLKDTTHAPMKWERWEQGSNGPAAVFRFRVSQKQSHYEVTYCCLPKVDPRVDAKGVFRERSGYHGEITIEPATGVVLRLALSADAGGLRSPITDADLLVEYGPVGIAGKSYDCPIKSITLTRVQLGAFAVYAQNLPMTMLTDTVFSNYHRFRGDLHILPDGGKSHQ
jgi:hypothetical protein